MSRLSVRTHTIYNKTCNKPDHTDVRYHVADLNRDASLPMLADGSAVRERAMFRTQRTDSSAPMLLPTRHINSVGVGWNRHTL